ncbi:hypothetical protein [Nocardia sp. NPDC004750]
MSFTTEIDHDTLSKARVQFATILGEFESAGQALSGVQHQFPAAVEGEIGTAIYNAVGNTYEHIKSLCNMLQTRIMDPMDAARIQADAEGMDRAGEIARLGNDGVTDVGNASGTWANNHMENTSAIGQDQSKIDLNF